MFSGDLTTRGRHQLHQADGACARADVAHEQALASRDTVGPGRGNARCRTNRIRIDVARAVDNEFRGRRTRQGLPRWKWHGSASPIDRRAPPPVSFRRGLKQRTVASHSERPRPSSPTRNSSRARMIPGVASDLLQSRLDQRIAGHHPAHSRAQFIGREKAVVAAFLARATRIPGAPPEPGPSFRAHGAPVRHSSESRSVRRHGRDVDQQTLPLIVAQAGTCPPAHQPRHPGPPAGARPGAGRHPADHRVPSIARCAVRCRAAVFGEGELLRYPGPSRSANTGSLVGQTLGRVDELLAIRLAITAGLAG